LLLVLVIGGTGYLYGGLIGAVVFKLVHDVISTWTPQYWQFWIGLILVILVLVGRERLQRWIMWGPDRIKGLFAARRGAAAGRKSP
jgi:branched-chain amino acid transport system permease protein